MDLTRKSPASIALCFAVARLLEVIEEENSILRQHQIVSHAGFTDRKNQALRELTAARKIASGAEMAGVCRPELQRLASALDDNAKLLKRHITAVGEVSDIIIAGLRDENSDGTYSRLATQYRDF